MLYQLKEEQKRAIKINDYKRSVIREDIERLNEFKNIKIGFHFNTDLILQIKADNQWTDTTTIRVEQDRMRVFEEDTAYDDTYKVNFTQSAGGWNENVEVRERLETSQKILYLIEKILTYIESERTQKNLKELATHTNSIYQISEQIDDLEKEIKQKETIAELDLKFLTISVNEIILALRLSNDVINLCYVKNGVIIETTLKNKSVTRLNIEIDGFQTISQKKLKEKFEKIEKIYLK